MFKIGGNKYHKFKVIRSIEYLKRLNDDIYHEKIFQSIKRHSKSISEGLEDYERLDSLLDGLLHKADVLDYFGNTNILWTDLFNKGVK